jgi:hypothetical protein
VRTRSAASVGWSRIRCIIYWESSFLAPFFIALCEIGYHSWTIWQTQMYKALEWIHWD